MILRIWLFFATFFILACTCGTTSDVDETGLEDSAFLDTAAPTDSGTSDSDTDDSGTTQDTQDSDDPPPPEGCESPSAGAPSDVICNAECWCWSHPLPGGGDGSGVWGTSSDDIWLSGFARGVVHWDGHTLTAHYSADGDVIGALSGFGGNLFGISSSQVHEYDGADWTLHSAPVSAGKLVAVHTVADSQLWVVGYESDSGTYTPRASYYDGAEWTYADPGLEMDAYLTSVAGQAVDQVYAGSSEGHVLAWDGQAWSQVGEQLDDAVLAVSVSPSGTLWVAEEDIIYRYDGASFVESYELSSGILDQLVALADDQVWAMSWDAAGHFDGQDWTWWDLGDTWLRALWVAPTGEAYVTGDSDFRRVEPSGDTTQMLGTDSEPAELKGIYVGADDDGWTVGDEIVMRFDGETWARWPSGPGAVPNLTDVHGSGPDDVWVVGYKTAWHWDGGTWTEHDSGADAWIYGVWVASESAAWAVGTAGTVLVWDGASWSTQDPGYGWNVRAVWGTGEDNVWISGDDGGLAQWNGNLWTDWSIDTSQDFYDLYTADGSQIYLVAPADSELWSWTAADGLVDVYDAFSAGQRAVKGTGADNLYSAGSFSRGGHYDGSSWTDIDPPVSGLDADTNAISIAPSGTVFYAGEARLVLQHEP